MKHTIEKTILLGQILEMCVGEGDVDLLDLIYKLLVTNMENYHGEQKGE